MEGNTIHIRHVMLWEFKQGNSAKATAEKINCVYGNGLLTEREVKNWFAKFRTGDTNLKDEPKVGCSSDGEKTGVKKTADESPGHSAKRQCIADNIKLVAS